MLVQERHNSSALTMELHVYLSCINLSIYHQLPLAKGYCWQCLQSICLSVRLCVPHMTLLLHSHRPKYFSGLVQDCGISSTSAMETPQSCTRPSISFIDLFWLYHFMPYRQHEPCWFYLCFYFRAVVSEESDPSLDVDEDLMKAFDKGNIWKFSSSAPFCQNSVNSFGD